MSYKTLKQGEEGFQFVNNKLYSVPRAMMHILPECPVRHRTAIQEAVENGWLVLKVNIPESELMWGELQQ
jgi:hypothetical protein